MKVAIMQPYFMPYIGYFQLIKEADIFVLFDDVNFIKKGWINRNRIIINNDEHMFTIPLIKASQNKKISDLFISEAGKEKTELYKKVYNSYRKSLNFKEVENRLDKIINCEELNLCNYIENSLKIICDYGKINTKIIKSSQIEKNHNLKGKDRIIEICKILGGNQYINACGGMELYKQEDFKRNNIDLKFLNSENIIYVQNNKIFIPNLSIIDLICNTSREEFINYLTKYKVI